MFPCLTSAKFCSKVTIHVRTRMQQQNYPSLTLMSCETRSAHISPRPNPRPNYHVRSRQFMSHFIAIVVATQRRCTSISRHPWMTKIPSNPSFIQRGPLQGNPFRNSVASLHCTGRSSAGFAHQARIVYQFHHKLRPI